MRASSGQPRPDSDRTVRVGRWFQGPTGSGQGGWTANRLVSAMGQPATVAIRAPIPLETELRIVEPATGDHTWRLVDPADRTVLEGTPWHGRYPTTEPVPVAEATEARSRFPVPGELHPVPVCFSCGLEPDSMGVHAGPLADGRFATDWTVPDWAAGHGSLDADSVDEGALWAALDCTAALFAGCEGGFRRSVTAQLAVAVLEPLRPAATYALVAWPGDWAPGGWEGRKRGAASAAFDEAGACIAVSTSFWIALD